MKEESKLGLVVYTFNPALRRQKQNDLCKFEVSLDFIERLSQKRNKNKFKKKWEEKQGKELRM